MGGVASMGANTHSQTLTQSSPYSAYAQRLSEIATQQAVTARANGQNESAAGFESNAKMWSGYAGQNIQGNGFGQAPQIINTPQEMTYLNSFGQNNPYSWGIPGNGPHVLGPAPDGGVDNTVYNEYGGTSRLPTLGGNNAIAYNGGIAMGPQTQGFAVGNTRPSGWVDDTQQMIPTTNFPSGTNAGQSIPSGGQAAAVNGGNSYASYLSQLAFGDGRQNVVGNGGFADQTLPNSSSGYNPNYNSTVGPNPVTEAFNQMWSAAFGRSAFVGY